MISVLSMVFSLRLPALSFDSIQPTNTEAGELNSLAFRLALEDMLTKKGIKFEKITVGSSENGQNGIIIDEITVYGVNERAECENFIKENTGVDRVTVYG